MSPLLPFSTTEQPWHSTPYQALPEVYVQNASLEIAWTRVIFENKNITGNTVMPFLTKGYEGFDVNHPYDLRLAEELINTGQVKLPDIKL